MTDAIYHVVAMRGKHHYFLIKMKVVTPALEKEGACRRRHTQCWGNRHSVLHLRTWFLAPSPLFRAKYSAIRHVPSRNGTFPARRHEDEAPATPVDPSPPSFGGNDDKLNSSLKVGIPDTSACIPSRGSPPILSLFLFVFRSLRTVNLSGSEIEPSTTSAIRHHTQAHFLVMGIKRCFRMGILGAVRRISYCLSYPRPLGSSEL